MLEPNTQSLETGSMMTVGLFPTPLVVAQVAGSNELNPRLSETILSQESVERGVSVSNLGGWHSKDFLPWSGPEGARIIEAARTMAARSTLLETDGDLTQADVSWRVSAWANVSRRGDSNKPHAHPGAFWSGVYWVADGGVAEDESLGGLLELADPRGVLPSMYAPHLRHAIKDCLADGRGQLVTPRAGSIILFPAWLIHSVTPYSGTGSRISVAFNLSL